MNRQSWLALWVVLGLTLGRVWSLPQADPDLYQRKSLSYQSLERTYYVHLPPAARQGKPLPLMILLHGGGGGAPQALDCYPLREVADREGLILVAPNGTGPIRREILRTWNVGFGFGAACRNKVDDTGFLRALILQVRRDYPVDPKRVYLTGLSNGAILCHWAGAANSDLIAGIAPVVGCVAGKEDERGDMLYPVKPQHPLDVILFNGGQDRSIPLEGGPQKLHMEEQERTVCSAQDSARFWVEANHCDPKPVVEELPEQKATRYTWSGGKEGTRVVLYVLHNQGHAWPGGKAPRGSADPPSTLLRAHQVMWDFFRSR